MPVTEAELAAAEAALGHPLPEDYANFLRRQDGLTEFVGEAYLDLWGSPTSWRRTPTRTPGTW